MWLGFICILHLACSAVETQDVIFGQNRYTEYKVGNMSLIISAPHGGSLEPKEIPDRDAGCWNGNTSCTFAHECPLGSVKNPSECRVATKQDLYTLDTALCLASEIFSLTGYYPHVIINHLSRSKLDANRRKEEAAFGIPQADQAWDEFMDFMISAKSLMTSGLVVDIHGHGHPELWIELGYTLSKLALDTGNLSASATSIYYLAQQHRNISFETLLRGQRSLGKFIEDSNKNYICVPSPTNPGPNGGNYFSGGYITKTFGSKHSGLVDAIQIELPRWIRESNERPRACKALAKALFTFWQINYCNQTNHEINGC